MVSITGEPRLCALFLLANANPNLADDQQFVPVHSVFSVKKDTKYSSVLLLCLVSFLRNGRYVLAYRPNVLVEIANHLPHWGLHWLKEIGHTTQVLR